MSLPATFPAFVEAARPGVCVDAACIIGAAAAVPTNAVAPTITGTAEVGETLTLGFGTWLDADTVVGRVERSLDGVNSWEAATSYSTETEYEIVVDDRPRYLRLRVRSENDSGQAFAISGTIGPVELADSDAEAYVSAVEEADGQALEPAVVEAYDTFIAALKADNIWDDISAACILSGARTLAGALVPLRGPAPSNVDDGFTQEMYNRKTGLVGDGSAYLDANRNNNADPQDDHHMAVWITALQPTLANRSFIGAGGAADDGATNLRSNAAGAAGIRHRSSSFDSTASLVVGFYGAARTGAAGFTQRFGGTDYPKTRTSQTPYDASVFVFNRNASAGEQDPCSDRLSWYSFGRAVTLAGLNSRIASLMTDIDTAIA